LGLEVGLMGEAHLVPFGSQCQLIPGYQGLMKLARNSGIVQDIYGHEVRINDKFDIVLGLNRSLVHEPLKKNGFPASDRGTRNHRGVLCRRGFQGRHPHISRHVERAGRAGAG
jgi:hypothetical protein